MNNSSTRATLHSVAALCALGVSLLTLAPEASAQGGETQNGTDTKNRADTRNRSDASKLIDEGVDRRVAGDEQGALTKFREAQKLFPTPRGAAQLGMAERAMRLYLDAERHLHEALSERADPWIQKNRETLERALTLTQKNLGWIDIESNAAGAKLSVNGNEVGELPLEKPIRVLAGEVVVVLQAEGYEKTQPVTVTVAVGKTATERIELTPLSAKPAGPPPVASKPSGPRPEPAPPVDPGPASSSGSNTLAYVAGGVGLVGIGVGSFLGLQAFSKKSERDDLCGPSATTCDDPVGVAADQDGRSLATYSTIAFGVGVVGLGMSIVLFTSSGESAPTVAAGYPGARLRIGPGSLHLDGRF